MHPLYLGVSWTQGFTLMAVHILNFLKSVFLGERRYSRELGPGMTRAWLPPPDLLVELGIGKQLLFVFCMH